jgi:DUF4097 and DUF4098 domain-containing protein YvlB
MERAKKHLRLILTLLAAAAAAGCAGKTSYPGRFERSLTVNGPARLELRNIAGNIDVQSGPPGQVVIRGSFEARAWPWENLQGKVAELAGNPPIEQSENLIQISARPPAGLSLGSFVANYSMTTPSDTEVHADSGSGDIRVAGIRGPVELATGSGKVTAEQIGGDARARAGSGEIVLREIGGEADASTGSGSITLADVASETRARSGSGDITIRNPRGTVTVKTGKGDIHIAGASDDVSAHGGLGDLTLEGSPRPAAYWELHTGVGDITLRVPPNASFRLHAHAGLGEIRSELPGLRVEHSRHNFRGQLGNGGARIEIETGAGDIRILPAGSSAPNSQ